MRGPHLLPGRSRVTAWTAALALASGPALVPDAARAHGDDPSLVPVVGAIEPAPPGLVVQARTTISEQLIVANPATTRLEILDPEGAPFLRVSAGGVFGNLTNPFFHQTLNPAGVPARVPPSARAGAEPRWVQVGEGESYGWFEPRLHPFVPGSEPATGPTVASWTIDMRYGDEPLQVRGTLERQEPTGSFRASAAPRTDGVEVSLAQGRPPALLLVAPAGRALTVQGSDGAPFLRLGARGVFANPASATFRENPDFAEREPGADGWVRVGEPGRVRWLDSRLAFATDRPPELVERAAQPAELARWEIPMNVDGAPAPLRGTISWLPAGSLSAQDGSGTSWRPYAVGGGFAVAALAVVVVARRRAAR